MHKTNVPTTETPAIAKITVQGFKSLVNETSIEIRPLTLLVGANGSGKSSIMQPLLMLKQALATQQLESSPVALSCYTSHFNDLQFRFSLTLEDGQLLNLTADNPSPPPIFATAIQRVLYVPAVRGEPQPTYHLLEAGSQSIVLSDLTTSLHKLGLPTVFIRKISSKMAVEVGVGRTTKSNYSDTVPLVDAGVSVCQVLAVVVTLLLAKPGQLVYVDQPELGLHPAGQAALAILFAEAVERGSRLVIETHSSILLLSIQTLIAEKQIDNRLVAMHWFSQNPDQGVTKVNSHFPNVTGSGGEAAFDDVELHWQRRYMRASNARLHEISGN